MRDLEYSKKELIFFIFSRIFRKIFEWTVILVSVTFIIISILSLCYLVGWIFFHKILMLTSKDFTNGNINIVIGGIIIVCLIAIIFIPLTFWILNEFIDLKKEFLSIKNEKRNKIKEKLNLL